MVLFVMSGRHEDADSSVWFYPYSSPYRSLYKEPFKGTLNPKPGSSKVTDFAGSGFFGSFGGAQVLPAGAHCNTPNP